MNDALSALLGLLDVEPLENNLFRGQSHDIGNKSVFGGQVLGQALAAALKTVDPARSVHSLHGYFLRPGDVKVPIVYDVDRIRDGKSFTTRRIRAIQHGEAIFNMAVSCQLPEAGVEHQGDMPAAPAPETLKSEYDWRQEWAHHLPEKARATFVRRRPVDLRPVDPQNPFAPDRRAPKKLVWFRVDGRLPDDPRIHQALLAFASDFGLMGTAMLPHGFSWFNPDVQGASLDHAMWFHRPFRADDWLLYEMESPTAVGARGLNFGKVWSRDGRLVCSVVQEGLQRVHGSR
ncbi:MAG: acyl-CoA thioesterase II [Pseudomonadota bacterium]